MTTHIRNTRHAIMKYGYFLFFFLLVNLCRLIILRGTGINTLTQADYMIIPVTAWFLSQFKCSRTFIICLTYLASFIAFSADVIVNIGKIFRWGPDAIPQYVSSYQDLPWSVIMPVIGSLVLLSLLVSVLLAWRPQAFAIWPLLVVVAALLAIDTQVGATRFNDGTSGINLITTSIPSIVPVYLNRAFYGASIVKIKSPTMFQDISDDSIPSQILSVSVESLGFANDKNTREYITKKLYSQLGDIYNINEYRHLYSGGTMQGEVRELCGLRLSGDVTNTRVIRKLKLCLPAMLAEKGYKTDAFHGNGSRFYSRLSVYPAMGFHRAWFYDDLKAGDKAVTPCPGTLFRGACDVRVYKRAISLFDGKKRFVHIMTLDSHLPLLGESAGRCPNNITDDPVICGYTHVVERSLSQLSEEIWHARSKPDVIYIYGDHAPPFNVLSERKRFSADAVPFYELRKISLQ